MYSALYTVCQKDQCKSTGTKAAQNVDEIETHVLLYYLTPSDIWTLEVGVKQKIEIERNVFVGIVNANVHVQLLLAENQSEMTIRNLYIRCQVHQHFMCAFFVQKCFEQLFSNHTR